MANSNKRILESPFISFVIVNYNGAKYLKRCLSSIDKQKLNHECLVIDNNSTDNSKEILKNFDTKNIFLNKNKGYPKAINIGLKISSGKYIFLMTPTTFLKKNSIKNLLVHIEQQKTGITAPKLIDKKGNIVKSIRRIPTPLSIFIGQIGLSTLNLGFRKIESWKLENFDYSKRSEVEQPMSCALLLKRKVIDDIGLFDERFFLYFSDVDFCKRVFKKYKILYIPNSEAIHIRGGSTKYLGKKRILIFNNDLLRYLKKHHTFVFFLFYCIIYTTGKIRYFFLKKRENELFI